jgi:hypothetical protein
MGAKRSIVKYWFSLNMNCLLNVFSFDSDTSFSEKCYEHLRRENVFIGRSPATAISSGSSITVFQSSCHSTYVYENKTK